MQQLNPSEISEIIKARIDQLDVTSEARNEGTIVSVTDGIIRIHGLTEVMFGEMIEFDGGIYGMALNLERDSVGAVILGDYKSLGEGQTCRCTGQEIGSPAIRSLLEVSENAARQPAPRLNPPKLVGRARRDRHRPAVRR